MTNREERLRQREEELISQIEALKLEYMERCRPIGEELNAIRESRGPCDFYIDGKTYHYIGPVPPYYLPEEKL